MLLLDINKASLSITTMKKCKYNAKIRCFHFSCDYIDSMGNVDVCVHHLNPFGFFMRRRVKVSPSLLRGVSR